MDAREYRLQTEGLAAALVAPEVRAAFLAVPGQPVMLHVFEWSGWQQQEVRQDWVTIAGEGDLVEVAARLAAQARSFEQFPTALGFALLFGGRALAERTDCARRTLDVSGDGTNNDGVSPEMARRESPLAGVTVNGLVIGATVVTLARLLPAVRDPGAGGVRGGGGRLRRLRADDAAQAAARARGDRDERRRAVRPGGVSACGTCRG